MRRQRVLDERVRERAARGDRVPVPGQLDYTGLTVVRPGVGSAYPDGARFSNVTLVRTQARMQNVNDFRIDLDTGAAYGVEGNFMDTLSVKQCVRNTNEGYGWNLFLRRREASPVDGSLYEMYEGEGLHEYVPEMGLVDMRLQRWASADRALLRHATSIRPCGARGEGPWTELTSTDFVFASPST